MTNYTFNSNPNELTSFEGGASPENSSNLLRYIFDLVRPGSSSSNAVGYSSSEHGSTDSSERVLNERVVKERTVIRDPSPDLTTTVRKVSFFLSKNF